MGISRFKTAKTRRQNNLFTLSPYPVVNADSDWEALFDRLIKLREDDGLSTVPSLNAPMADSFV